MLDVQSATVFLRNPVPVSTNVVDAALVFEVISGFNSSFSCYHFWFICFVTVRFLMDSLVLVQQKSTPAAQKKWPISFPLHQLDCVLRADTTVGQSWKARRSLFAPDASSWSRCPNCGVNPVMLSFPTPRIRSGRNLTRTPLISSA